MFGPVAILERLESSLDLLAGGARDLPERQRTLRGAISWSHDLLSEDEQAIFRRLAVFVGGWDAEIAQKVVDPSDGLGLLVVDGLEALADKSMVRVSQTEHGEPRFDRHTLLREFALDRLDASGERPDCERRHALAFLDLAATAGPSLVGPEVDRWMDRLGHEQHNLRAALRWSIASGEPEVGLRDPRRDLALLAALVAARGRDRMGDRAPRAAIAGRGRDRADRRAVRRRGDRLLGT